MDRYWRVAYKSAQDGLKRFFACGLPDELVRDVVVVGRDLHGDLSTRFQPAIQIRDQLRMILRPLQRGVAEDQVPFTAQVRLVSLHKLQSRA